MLWRPARSEAANRPHRAAKACHPRILLFPFGRELVTCRQEGTWWRVCHALAAGTVGGSEPAAPGRQSMPPSDTSLSLLQGANYLPARGKVGVGVPCFGGRHGRRQRTGRTGPPKHATLGYFTFPFAACYLDSRTREGRWSTRGAS